MNLSRVTRLEPSVEEAFRRHCEREYPNEACGLIVGLGDGIDQAWTVVLPVPASNEHEEDRTRRYAIPSDLQFETQLKAEARGLDVIGYYHSHPDHPAEPSEYDREQAWYGYLYIICAVERGVSGRLSAFAIEEPDGRFSPAEWIPDTEVSVS